MCLTCGCHQLDEDHGQKGHLTLADLAASAKLDGISLKAAASRIVAELARTPSPSPSKKKAPAARKP